MQKSAELTRIALVHLITGFVMFLGMGLLGYAMRLEQAGFWSFGPSLFYEIMTLHGAGMVTAALIAAIGGLIEVLNGSTPLSARLLWTAYVIGSLASAIVILAVVVGGVGAGWTMLYPLPYHSLGEWTTTAAAAVYVGYFLTAVAFLLYCIAFLRGTLQAAGGLGKALALRYLFSAGKSGRESLPSPSQLAAVVVSLDGIGTVILGFVWLIPRFIQGAGLIGSMDALFVKNVLMLYGHMITNLAMYTALGILLALLPILTGRELRTSLPLVLALDLVLVVLFLPFGHHLYQDFVEPKVLLFLGEFVSLASTVPVLLVAILGGLSLIYRSGMRWSVPSILVCLGLWGWTFGGIAGFMDAAIPVNQVTHNTLWVPGHFHTYYLLGVLAFTFAYMYYLVTERSGTRESVVSRAAAWLYGIGGAGFVLMFLLSGALSVPRRYAQHLAAWQLPDRISVGFVGLIALALLWFGGEVLLRVGRAWRGPIARSETGPEVR
jgi:cytochrome c oxidase subunit I